MSRKDAKAQSFVLCFLGGASRKFWEGSAICVTEVFRIKKTISKKFRQDYMMNRSETNLLSKKLLQVEQD